MFRLLSSRRKKTIAGIGVAIAITASGLVFTQQPSSALNYDLCLRILANGGTLHYPMGMPPGPSNGCVYDFQDHMAVVPGYQGLGVDGRFGLQTMLYVKHFQTHKDPSGVMRNTGEVDYTTYVKVLNMSQIRP